jgi:integrase/recombinase XerC
VRRKGGKIKPIRLHGYLIQTILDYARSEREQIEGVKEPYLLLNASGRLKGRRISRRTLQRRFAAACIAVGAHVVREAVGHDGVAEQVKVHPAFTFHDLRHTFAVWSYWALKEAGDDAPWKTIQEQLGHENVAVTINTYLAVTSALESVVSDEYVLRLKAIANSQTSNLALH